MLTSSFCSRTLPKTPPGTSLSPRCPRLGRVSARPGFPAQAVWAGVPQGCPVCWGLLMVKLDRRASGTANWRLKQGNYPLKCGRPHPRRGHGPRSRLCPPEGPRPGPASSGGLQRPWACGRITPVSASVITWHLLSLMRTLVIGFRDTQIIQNEPILRPLITPAKSVFQKSSHPWVLG